LRSNLDYEAEYIEGFVENIIYRNEDNGYTVFNVVYKGEEITCVGVFSYINAGEFITANGGFVKHPSYDMQFSIKSYELKNVPSRSDVILHPVLSKALVKKWLRGL
jgi:exodeoxyribonuclease V alpha subunit